jgi:hypothetical protein
VTLVAGQTAQPQLAGGAFRLDGRAYSAADVIHDGLNWFAKGQDADRFAVRLIRPLYWANGSPILDGRGEQRRAILAGVFELSRLADIAEQIAELNGRAIDDPRDSLGIEGAVGGIHVYAHIQRITAPTTDRLLPGALGTVRLEGVAQYTTLVIDIDSEPGAGPDVAVKVAFELAEVLVDTVGVPHDAILVMQTGRGAYVLVAIEPQPISARPVMQLATRTLARMIKAAGDPVHGDESVFDAPRIVRVPGTVNHKPDADPATPAWILRPWTPGVRTPWSVVERIAAKSRPKLKLLRHAAATTGRRPLRDLFVARGWFYRDRHDGVADVRCPNAEQHTDGRDGAILYPPTKLGGPGWLKCSHAHCAQLTLFDVYRLLERA